MGTIYDIKVAIDKSIKDKNLNEFEVKGKIGLKTGVMLVTITPLTPDDPDKIKRLKDAAKEVLGLIL